MFSFQLQEKRREKVECQRTDDEEWHDLGRMSKERHYGMTDLWDPARRAQLCASCHVGDVREGKVVTHAMYAAGHPPLPGLEVATFSEQMPRHWQYLSEKPPEVQKLLQYNPAQLEKSQLVAVSGALAEDDTQWMVPVERVVSVARRQQQR